VVIASFRDEESLAIFNDERSNKSARKRLPVEKWNTAQDCMRLLLEADLLRDIDSANVDLDKIKGDREGQLSMKIDRQHRLCFYWHNNEAHAVEVIDYHS